MRKPGMMFSRDGAVPVVRREPGRLRRRERAPVEQPRRGDDEQDGDEMNRKIDEGDGERVKELQQERRHRGGAKAAKQGHR